MHVIGQDGHELREGHRAPLIELDHLALMLALAWAVLAAAEQQEHGVAALQLGEAPQCASVVGQLEVRQYCSGYEYLAHGLLPRVFYAEEIKDQRLEMKMPRA